MTNLNIIKDCYDFINNKNLKKSIYKSILKFFATSFLRDDDIQNKKIFNVPFSNRYYMFKINKIIPVKTEISKIIIIVNNKPILSLTRA